VSAVLQLDDVRVAFPDGPDERIVLDALHLAVDAGELVVVSGRSGSGKSTLLTVAGLLRRPDAGEVTVAGTATCSMSERRRTTVRRDHIAFVYQSANLLPSLTAIEQLELVGHIRDERSGDVRARAGALLEQLDLSDRARQLPSQLSGGERQRVGIARALMASPAVLIADEPTASLDPERAAIVADLLRTAATERGIATVVVAHDDAALGRADRHLRLSSGRLDDMGAGATVGT
jgi:putative ABC transport system ATP-binding protein